MLLHAPTRNHAFLQSLSTASPFHGTTSLTPSLPLPLRYARALFPGVSHPPPAGAWVSVVSALVLPPVSARAETRLSPVAGLDGAP